MMGSNSKGQLGLSINQAQIGSPSLVERMRSFHVENVSCGADFTFAIVRANRDCLNVSEGYNEVYSWGNNSMGQLAQD